MKIAVIGGGLTGLAAAYTLAKAGHQVYLWEKENELGGQAKTFDLHGSRLEGFYHHIFLSDAEIVQLLQELGLSHSLAWLPSSVGLFHEGKVYPFTTPWDLLRFPALSLPDRLRLGLLSLYLQRTSRWQKWEGVTAQQWLSRYAGRRAFEVIWQPLLRGKFGDHASQITMAWIWSKMRLRVGSRGLWRERLGYLEGSFGLLIDALAQEIEGRGGQVYKGVEVTGLQISQGRVRGVEVEGGQVIPCQGAIATISNQALLRLVPELPPDYRRQMEAISYLAALCLVLVLKRRFMPVYWLNIADISFPFVAAIQHTNLVPPAYYGGKHILYLSHYLPPEDSLCRQSPLQVLEGALPHLKRINPAFDRADIEEYHLFGVEAAQPIITTFYDQKRPPLSTPVAGLYLANTSQIYPQDRGMNYSLRLGREVAQHIISGRETRDD